MDKIERLLALLGKNELSLNVTKGCAEATCDAWFCRYYAKRIDILTQRRASLKKMLFLTMAEPKGELRGAVATLNHAAGVARFVPEMIDVITPNEGSRNGYRTRMNVAREIMEKSISNYADIIIEINDTAQAVKDDVAAERAVRELLTAERFPADDEHYKAA